MKKKKTKMVLHSSAQLSIKFQTWDNTFEVSWEWGQYIASFENCIQGMIRLWSWKRMKVILRNEGTFLVAYDSKKNNAR
jgi:hypothetical protein